MFAPRSYDAIAAVTSTNVWIDGNVFQDGPKPVLPEYFLDGWWVDRYDGLFDAEDGCDNITFSHVSPISAPYPYLSY